LGFGQTGPHPTTDNRRLINAMPPTPIQDLSPPSAARRRRRGVALDLMLHAPQTLRALVRADELSLVVLAAGIGIVAGLLVVAMNQSCQLAHEILYGLASGERLSAQTALPAWRALGVPCAGGLVVGLFSLAVTRWFPGRTIDPIEANALYGGTMSVRDSIIVVLQTMLSNGAGASVGLEAGYTQIGAAVASRVGRAFRVRRADLRLLVGCGAAGAISAAFNAPLTGAFYAFELVIGTYSLATLAPVVVSAIAAVSIMRLLLGDEPGFDVSLPAGMESAAFLPLIALGVLCALAGIAIMRGVTLTETLFRRSRMPAWLRPAVGGLALGGLALINPAVLSAGHGALRAGLTMSLPLQSIALLILLKATASAVSLGSGFRGGLFFASLFLGALVGKLFSGLMLLASPVPLFPEVVYALVGMSALAVAIVGGPLTMCFLALESTGSLPLTVAVLAAAVVSSLTVRRTFGYSFATWRFHLRGEAIRSAVDIGWVRNLTVGRMMREVSRVVRVDISLDEFRREFPLGSANRVIAVDDRGRYAGIVWVSDAHAADSTVEVVAQVLHTAGQALLPQMTIKEAVQMFETAEADALAVVDGRESLQVIGMLTEQYALRRYSEELDRRRRDISGE
jgi:CIC family chloride channel protein